MFCGSQLKTGPLARAKSCQGAGRAFHAKKSNPVAKENGKRPSDAMLLLRLPVPAPPDVVFGLMRAAIVVQTKSFLYFG